MLKVQIAISGQYMENYGAHDWNGTGACPQYWKYKGAHTELVVCNVDIVDIPAVVAEIESRMHELSWSDNHSSCHYSGVEVFPNRLAYNEMVEWEYAAYENIKSITQQEIVDFLEAFGKKVPEAVAEVEPAGKYDEYESYGM